MNAIRARLASFLIPLMMLAAPAFAAEGEYDDAPKPLQLGLHHAATPMMERLVGFHDGLLWMCVLITLFVLGLLLWVAVRYNAKSNPVPSRTTHNVLIEIIWTVVPVLHPARHRRALVPPALLHRPHAQP
jgi:cytochrome c oxidase subunit 2